MGNIAKIIADYVSKEVANVRKVVANVRKEVSNVGRQVTAVHNKLDNKITREIGIVKKGQLHCLTGYKSYSVKKADQDMRLPVKFSRSFANTPVLITSVTKARNYCWDYDAPDFIVYPYGINRGGFTLFSDVMFKSTCGKT